MPNLIQLQERKSSILGQAAQLLSKGLKSKDARRNYESLLAASDSIDNDIAQLRYINAELAKHPAPVTKEDTTEVRRQKVNKAFRSYLRHGWQPDRFPELRDIELSGDGAVLVPVAFSETSIEASKYAAPLLQYVFTKDVSNGEPVKLPKTDSTSQYFTLVAEGNTVPEQDPTVSSVSPNNDLLDSLSLLTKYSFQELNDAFDLNEFLQKNVAEIAARSIERYITLGTDGANNVAQSAPTGGLIGSLSTAVTLGSASTITYTNMLALKSSLDMSYQLAENSAFMAHPTTVAYLAGLLDSTGRPLFTYDEDGYLVVANSSVLPNASFPAFGTQSASATTPVVAFGQWDKYVGFVHTQVRFRTLLQRFADKLEGGLVSYLRVASLPGISAAAAAIVTPQS